jgi:FtsZ-binding cell division protein ZapB
MNLQIPSHLSMRTITRLKEQNRQLTQEVSDCSHRVTQLETEKAMLLRQLFHQKNNLHPDETVYM